MTEIEGLSEYYRGYFEGFTNGIRFAFALLKDEKEEKMKTKLHFRSEDFPDKSENIN